MSAIPDQLRREVNARAGGFCEYCRLPPQGQVATFPIDHIRPRTLGGATRSDNLALACPHCNALKWSFTDGPDPLSGQIVPLYDPRTDHWSEHFQWSPTDRTVLEGLTPRGRATVLRMQMNAPEMLTIRRLLAELGIPLGA